MSLLMILIYTVCGIYMLCNFKYDIQMLQQNSYRIDRYWRWLNSGYLMTTSRLIDVALLMLLFSTLLPVWIASALIAIVELFRIFKIATQKYKKPLVFTKRVVRLYCTVGIIAMAIYVCLIIFCRDINTFNGANPENPVIPLGGLLIITMISWAFVIAGVIVMKPVENAINRKYYNDARRILSSMPDLKIIGITGSFGKTSTKHYLQTILSQKYDVLITPGSYNTTMGVIRTVREYLKPYNEVFICEMGAKQPGDIKEISDLVKPEIGVVTAVGPMHLETFKTLENVQKTKFELIDSLPENGLGVINNDFDLCASRTVSNVPVKRYGVRNTSDNCAYTVSDIEYSQFGTKFTVLGPDGLRLSLETRLVGECNISNLLAAVIVAKELNVPDDKIRYAVKSIEQVEHRLNMKRTPGGITIIDDAFNSNPFGSKMAVDVLERMNDGKRIIVTPGMIELGDSQIQLNEEFGEYIGNRVDIAVIVGTYNREAILKGVSRTNLAENSVYAVDSFDEAQKLLASILTKGDTVLYENDLPDTFK